jgi:hypothetical protein
MTDSETEDDGWEQGSRDEEQSEESADDVQEVEASGSRSSAKPILSLPGTTRTHLGHTLMILLWTTGSGTTSKLTDGNALPDSSHREASIHPSTNGCS